MKPLSSLAIACALLVLGGGCASVQVTPAALEASAATDTNSVATLRRWREAVVGCNGFLHSTNRKTLPPGIVRLTNDGMEFVTSNSTVPVRIRCTSWGDVVVLTGFAAQERSDGFVVGRDPPNRSRLTDNSFFRNSNGSPLSGPEMAELTLHELTHVYYHCGTVSFGKGVRYYLEAVFLFRYRNHSMERLPFQTSTEFVAYYEACVNQVR